MPSYLPLVLLAALTAWSTPPAESPYATSTPGLSGQLRTRTEFDTKGASDTASSLINTQLRSRLGFTAQPADGIEAKVEFQDVRFWGSEPVTGATAAQTATVGDAKGVDLLQGYFTVTAGPVKAALGRQKMQLGSGRFLSTLEWSPTSRAFDGLSANWNAGSGDLTGLLFLVRDTSAAVSRDRLLLSGLFYDNPVCKQFALEAYAFYDQSRLNNVYGKDTLTNYDLLYAGERATGRLNWFAYEEEFIWQGGEAYYQRNLTSAAFQLALRLGVVTPAAKANLGLDVMSGDSDPTDNTTSLYRANYYFAHAYFGWMDYFATNPKYGVMDWRGDVALPFWKAGGQSASLLAQYHWFTPQNAPSGHDASYGQEVDGELHLGLYPKTLLVLGAAAFFPGASAYMLPGAKLGATQNRNTATFFYIMPTVNF